MGPGAASGNERILDVERCTVVPDDPRVGPKVALVAVGIPVPNAVHAHGHRFETGDERDQIDVMAADVSERIRVFRGAPILKVGVPVVPLLHEAGGAQAKVPEESGAIFAAGHQAAVVEAFVVLDPDQKTPIVRDRFDLLRLAVTQHQRLDATDMLIVFERRHHHVEVQLIGYGDNHNVAARQAGDGFAEELGLRWSVMGWPPFERLTRESLTERRRSRQRR